MKKNKNTIIRLASYRNALNRLKNMGFVRVFSDNLADALGITSAQVRKDFSLWELTGKKRGGYIIDELIKRLNNILGKDRSQKVIVVGAGNLGKALIHYQGFSKAGIHIVAGFDIDPAKQGDAFGIPILAMDSLIDFIKKNNIRIGVIAVPDIAAQIVLELLLSAGVKGILNFAPIRLRAPEEVTVNNVNLGLELETVIYSINTLEFIEGE